MSDGDTANSNEDTSFRTQSEESVVESSLALDDASRNATSNSTVAAEVSCWTAKITVYTLARNSFCVLPRIGPAS